MISVSDSFKKAIKSDTRDIHGYVEIKYQDNTYNLDVNTIPTLANIVLSDGSGLISNKKIMKKYVTLEENYTLLDGSFVVWNSNIVDDVGVITQDTFENMIDAIFAIENTSPTTTTRGITIYFRENLPFDFDVIYTFNDETTLTDNVRNNDKMIYQYIFDEEKQVSEITFEILNVEYPKHRLKIACVDFNLGDLYEDDELVNFDVIEELDLFVESLPINTCTININNYPNASGGSKFDPLNPQGITQYLTGNVTIEPYVGVLTQENGIEYVKMGVFYLTDWNSNNDGNVIFNGSSVLNKLKSKEMIWNSSMFSSSVYTPTLATMIENTADVTCSFPEYSMPLDNWSNGHTKLFDYLSYISPCLLYNDRPSLSTPEFRKIYVNRYNTIVIDNISNTLVDSIDRHFLVEDVTYTSNKPVKNVIANYTVESSSVSTVNETIINTMYTLTKPIEYLWFNTQKYIAHINSIQGTVSSGSATLTLIGHNSHLVHVKIEGTVGSIININCNASVPSSSKNGQTASYVDTSVDDGDTINLNFGGYEIPNFYSIQTVFFDLDRPYKLTAQTMGDPSIEIGDTIAIQTRYLDTNDGYKNIMVTKQHFTYDGGLHCSLEGLGD